MVKVKEVVERNCCSYDDLIVYKGNDKLEHFFFCKHCGQLWKRERKKGDMDAFLHRVLIKEYVLE